MTTPRLFKQQTLNSINNPWSPSEGTHDGYSVSRPIIRTSKLLAAGASLLLLSFLNTALAQNLPCAHWINASGQDAVSVLNGGGVFTTSFKGNNDLKVTQLSGQVSSIYLDTFGGDSPGNNLTWITQFVGSDSNGTGDGTAGDINDLEMSGDDTGSLQFDFLSPLTPNDRILLADVDFDEAYLLKAYVLSNSHYVQVSLTNWIAQDFSGSTDQTPDSTWPVWNASAGTLVSGSSDGLDEELFVLTPDRSINRFVITKQTGSGYTTAIQFFSPVAITNASPLPAGAVGVSYIQALTAINGTLPYTWTLTSGALPAGLQLSSAGVISGKPAAAATASFTVKVTDKSGITATRKFSLSVIASDTTKPTITITSPTSGQRWSNAVFTVKGTAKDNQQVQGVWCQTNGVWGAANTSNGWTNWTVDVALVPGTNVIKACAADTSWNWSPTQSVSLVYVVSDKLKVLATGPCTMSPNYSNAVLQVGASYSTTVTPGKGYVLSNWVGSVLGNVVFLSNTSKLTFTMKSNLVVQANVIPNPFIAMKGSYNGLFAQFPRAQGSSGFFTLSLATNGAYSGSLRQGTNTYPFTGQFDFGGVARQVISRPNTNPWVAGMGLDLAAQQIRGWVSNGISGGGVGELVADLAVFDARTNPATQYAGKYTVDVPGGTNEDGTVWLGDSYLTLTVDTGGKVTYSGYLADGTPVGPTSVPVSGLGTVPVYVPLYASKGSLFGWLTFDSSQPSAGLTGWLNWIKHANAGACYPAGLTNQVTVDG